MSFLSDVFSSVGQFFTGPKKASDLSDWAKQVGAPFSQYRDYYGGMLKDLMADPSSITKDPGYSYGLNTGLEAVKRQESALGFTGSGNELFDLAGFASGYAGDYLQKAKTFLSHLAGADIAPNTSGAINAQQNAADQSGNLLNEFGSLFGMMGGGGFGASSSFFQTPAQMFAGGVIPL